MSTSALWEPEGPLVSTAPALTPHANPTNSILGNSLPSTCVQSVTLVPLSETHSEDLFASLGGPQNAHLWKYMPHGPINDYESFAEHVKFLIKDGVFFTILKHDSTLSTHQNVDKGGAKNRGTPSGIVCLMNIRPEHHVIEIGYVLFSRKLQRTTAATEAIYLLMKHCFEDLGYWRVEWKTNNFNEPSKRAALRLGFMFEGVFRKHMVVKGRSRNTFWASVTDEEWPVVKAALEGWLEKSNFDESEKQVRKLEEIRAGLVEKSADLQQG
jgi:RimJ/RimL family protein N-acetyltransferase